MESAQKVGAVVNLGVFIFNLFKTKNIETTWGCAPGEQA